MVPVGLNWPGGPGGPELQLTDFAASWLKHNGFEINSEVAYPFTHRSKLNMIEEK